MTSAAAPPAGRRTTIVALDAVPRECQDVLAATALRRGLDWRLDRARLFWTTENVPAARGFMRRRGPNVRTVGCLDDRHLAWCVSAQDGDHQALVVRLDQVSIRDGSTLSRGVSPRALASTGWDDEGIEIRGDLGGSGVATVFLGIGSDTPALHVREAVLEAAGQTREV